jgi:hypothetical protein
MSNPNSMPPVYPPPHRPPFPHPTTPGSYYRDERGNLMQNGQNGRPSPINTSAQSPPAMNYSSPSPQYPSSFSHPPPPKRPRLSEEPTSALSPPNYPPTPLGQSPSPVLGQPTNGFSASQPRPGSMLPPQRPIDRTKPEDNYEDVLSGTGINVEEEERALSRPDFYSRNSFSSQSYTRQPNPAYPYNQMSPNGMMPVLQDPHSQPGIPEPSPEERQRRMEERADWDAARHSANPLWDMLLNGGPLNDRIRKISIKERLADPQSGVLVNTQKSGPPPIARVNGLEGATRLIDRGQAILDSENKGQRLADIMKLISLATKARLTGLISASYRISSERRLHSKGLVPTEWHDLAVRPKEASVQTDATDRTIPAKRMSLPLAYRKDNLLISSAGTLSQANGDDNIQIAKLPAGEAKAAATLRAAIRREKAEEELRLAKRVKRRAAAAAAADGAAPGNLEATTEAELMAAVQDAEKKTTKKNKQAAAEVNPSVLAASVNSTARMAAGGFGGRFGGKKGKNYAWMSAGASGTSTPTKPATSTTSSAANTPAQDRARPQSKEKQFGNWDEDKGPLIQLRDIVAVLETDGQCPQSYVKACQNLDNDT